MTEPPIPPMSMEELHEVSEAISWGATAISRAAGINKNTVARWWSGAREIPPPVAAWLRTLADLHRANPPPVPRPYIAEPTDGEDQTGG